ncbi:OB-fold nucleic acid binding domain-containing protein [Methanobrevibacter sp.]|uniref:OB-fold nucleic acid binding domain-containing protein n=1 Tax=Methanobrevibacter sp. TaxID=66852 RepID=UPI00386D3DB3
MQEEILELYEKIKDQLSKEEFQAEMDELIESNKDLGFFDELNAAQEVLKNHGIDVLKKVENVETSQELPFDVNTEKEESELAMTDDILKIYEEVQDKISKEDFLARMNEFKNQDPLGPDFQVDDTPYANMVAGELRDMEVKAISEQPEYSNKNIEDLEKGANGQIISGRVMSISNPRSFKTRKGGEGKVCNVELQDNTGSMRTVFWTPNIKLLKNIKEGDIIQIKDVDIKEGYSGLEANLRLRSTVVHLDEDPSKYPVYEEDITNISDIEPDTKVNIIARIVRIPTIRSYEKNGKEGKVASLELQDSSGKISYTLWNNSVKLIESLGLEDGDTVKILQAQARQRPDRDGNMEITLTHWDGRIIKGDFDVPEVIQEFTPIADLIEQKDVAIKGIVSRLQDIKLFIRKTDNTEGRLRNFDVRDVTGEIRVTLWGDDTALPLNKGDIVKVIGGDVRFDEYTQSQYSMNTNFNTQITINPSNLSAEELEELNDLRADLHPIPIGEVELMDDDGVEIDVVGRILSIDDIREFEREDDEIGKVRSAMFADESGKVRLSLWNEKAEGAYEVGEAYRIENARTRMGMYSVDLNIGGGSRIIRLSEEEASSMFIPKLETLEKALYDKIDICDVEEDETDKILIGRVIDVYEVRNFERDNGEGFVRNIEIADDTGSIIVVLWNDDAKREFEIGQPIKLQNPRFRYNENTNRIDANVSGSTSILEPNEAELEKLPSQEELIEAIYVPKSIEALSEDDTNVLITGKIKEVRSEKYLLQKCPNCNANVEVTEIENKCDYCDFEFDEPKYVLMIPTRIEDDTGEIQVTFFGNLAEELLGMKTEDIVRDLEQDYAHNEKIEDLTNLTVEIIADVGFDQFGEEYKLTPKRILSKYF